jgi:4-amino-4-deoxy-L-arabinose transferase-like glycosyltransferase
MFIPAEAPEFDGLQVASMVASILIVVLGLRAAYKANGGAQGPDLAGRLLALGWVLGVRLIVLWLGFFVVLIVWVFVGAAADREPSDLVITATAVAFTLLASVVYFWRLAHHLKDLHGPPPTR